MRTLPGRPCAAKAPAQTQQHLAIARNIDPTQPIPPRSTNLPPTPDQENQSAKI